jgi:hypothetical protein
MSIDGIWTITLKTPLGSQQATLHFATEGGVLTGSIESRLGSGNIANGKIDGNTAQWEAIVKLPVPMTAEFNANIDGDSISGTMAMGRVGKAPFKGMRG